MSLFFEWTGRVDNNSYGKRLHEVVENVNVDKLKEVTSRHFGIIGFESDEGVRRNKGRVGASKAPNKIRKFLTNIPYHFNENNVIDIGNVRCLGNNLEDAQDHLGKNVANLIKYQYTPIILGGGHETFYGHYLGVRNALSRDKKIGIINLDAHFDLRKQRVPSSGTMFHQVLESDKNAGYLCIGIQELGNTEQLFLTANELKVEYILETELSSLQEAFTKIDVFSEKYDVVIYTICTDVFNQTAAPGVSAPTPFGLDPKVVRAITKHVVNQKNFLSIDVSEVNPEYDIGDKTSRLISHLIAEILMYLNKRK